MDEAGAYERLKPTLDRWGMDPHRVENVLNAGTPDVNYTGGWIENKYIPQWPKRASTLIRLMEDRPEQAVWLYRRWISGGAAWVMLRAASHYYLFSGFDALTIRRGVTQDELLRLCCWNSCDHSMVHLRHWLMRQHDVLPPTSRARLLRLLCSKTVEQTAELLSITPDDVVAGETELHHDKTNDLIDAWVA